MLLIIICNNDILNFMNNFYKEKYILSVYKFKFFWVFMSSFLGLTSLSTWGQSTSSSSNNSYLILDQSKIEKKKDQAFN